ncbi:MAG: hypothetical protein KAX10_00665 [Candidatus Lokiarchaeota archaeon]|nr:hypothetical protein [Candidatus Lokiarchaeota archaeon]
MIDNVLLFKIGGKIIDNKTDLDNTISQLRAIKEIKPSIKSIILIAGGGSNVDEIRKSYKRGEINDEVAHWQAIKIMDLNAIKIQDLNKDFTLTDSFIELTRLVSSSGQFKIINFPTFKYLKRNDELPHNWKTTSDSISYFIASKLNLLKCFLIKDLDGIYLKDGKKIIKNLSINDFQKFQKNDLLFNPIIYGIKKQFFSLKKQSTPIDSYLLTLIKEYKLDCIILNGKKPSTNITKYFQSINEDEKVYTKLYCDASR